MIILGSGAPFGPLETARQGPCSPLGRRVADKDHRGSRLTALEEREQEQDERVSKVHARGTKIAPFPFAFCESERESECSQRERRREKERERERKR